MALSPVVTKNEVIGTEELTEGTRADSIHGTRLKVNKHCTWHILASRSLINVS
jgi:hypothetical protein